MVASSPSKGSSSPPQALATSQKSSFLVGLFRSTSRDKDDSGVATSSEVPAKKPVVRNTPAKAPLASQVPKKPEKEKSTGWLSRRGSSKKADKDRKDSKREMLSMALNKTDVKGGVEDEWPMYSGDGQDYELGEAIGFGATSVVRLSTYKPLNQVVAVKVMDFEGQDSIKMMQREVELMSLSKHPNILRVRGDWVAGSKLCIATRFIPHGSLLDILDHAYRDGLDEAVCATILKQAAEGMSYLHINGWLHRDIKAGNLLVDIDGTVLLSDFGCSRQITNGGSSIAEGMAVTRKSFVGTPCWMAPEVVEQRPYDSKADIWSFGITCIEIATGRAPHSLYTPAQILLKTVAEKPPTLDIDAQAHPFSKQYKDMIDTCLQKDPTARPTAEKLLAHIFFKQAKRKQHLVGALLAGLPAIQQRQTRRTRNSVLSLSSRLNQSVWDFDGSPVIDQFQGFSMTNNDQTPAVTPVHSRFPSGTADSARGTPRSISRRRNNSSVASAHKRGVSFDVLSESAGEDREPLPEHIEPAT